MRGWRVWLIGSACVAALAACLIFASSPARLYRWTGSRYHFNRAVSQLVPKGSTLAQLEAVVGPATRAARPSWISRQFTSDPQRFPDGWREGDDYAVYHLPDRTTWYFQVRNGRLVNYDPAVVANQSWHTFAGIR